MDIEVLEISIVCFKIFLGNGSIRGQFLRKRSVGKELMLIFIKISMADCKPPTFTLMRLFTPLYCRYLWFSLSRMIHAQSAYLSLSMQSAFKCQSDKAPGLFMYSHHKELPIVTFKTRLKVFASAIIDLNPTIY
ncbi:hypothetical protein HUJ04_010673 [Dendroctonus ponderosae]|nr:hypothetical protein HUJ04_010673 [Dendroctonus ponderosae]